MGHTLMDGMSMLLLGGLISVLRRPLHKYSLITLVSLSIQLVMVQKSTFEKFPNLYKVARTRNSYVSLVLISSSFSS